MHSSVGVTATSIEPADIAGLRRQERRALVQPAVALVATDPDRADVILDHLSGDPAWQVRKELAEHLIGLDDDRFARFAGRLSEDCNRFVCEAVGRSLDRRRKGAKEAVRRARAQSEVDEMQTNFERRYGPKATRQAKRMAERLYDTVVGATVHELRGLVAPLADTLETLNGQFDADQLDVVWAKQKLPLVRRRLNLVFQVLEDMREFSRATPATRRPEALSTLCHEAIVLAQDWFHASGIDATPVRIDVQSEPGVFVEVARHQIIIALRNLVKNAIESFLVWRRKEVRVGTVHINVARDRAAGQAIIAVADTGAGLRPEDLEKVRQFRPGHTSKKEYGTGFGLPIAYRKVTDHGGSLTIESSPASGTTVFLTLPLQATSIEEDLL